MNGYSLVFGDRKCVWNEWNMLPIISYLRSAPTKRENNNVHTQIEQKKKTQKTVKGTHSKNTARFYLVSMISCRNHNKSDISNLVVHILSAISKALKNKQPCDKRHTKARHILSAEHTIRNTLWHQPEIVLKRIIDIINNWAICMHLLSFYFSVGALLLSLLYSLCFQSLKRTILCQCETKQIHLSSTLTIVVISPLLCRSHPHTPTIFISILGWWCCCWFFFLYRLLHQLSGMRL